MPKRALTDRWCQTAKSVAVQTDYFDAQCPGLALRVASTGRKTWSWFFTWGGKRARMTLGTYPATSLAAARTKAEEARSALEGGRDPRATVAKVGTLQSIFDEYLRRTSVRSIDQRTAVFNRVILPGLGASPINEIRRSDIIRLLDTIEDERGPSAANSALGHLSAVMNWHAARDDDFVVPIRRGMARAEVGARDRVLTDDELRQIWHANCARGSLQVFHRYIKFLLLTAVRRTEAADMPWSEVVGDLWVIPKERMKNGHEHVVPLSPMAREVIGANGSGLVFGRIMPNIAYLKRGFDAASGVNGWVLHDTRRSARSLLSRAGVAPDIAERVLAHRIPGIRNVYDKWSYLPEKRDALERLAKLIGEIVHG